MFAGRAEIAGAVGGEPPTVGGFEFDVWDFEPLPPARRECEARTHGRRKPDGTRRPAGGATTRGWRHEDLHGIDGGSAEAISGGAAIRASLIARRGS
jgi:hypothetical protein